MSYLPPDHGYFAAVQAFFTEVTGRASLFGSRDQLLLQEWHAQGRSAHLVCRGIRNAVRALGPDDLPRSLVECRPFVDEEWALAREHLAGSHSTAASPSPKSPDTAGSASPTSLFDQAALALREAGAAAEPRFQEAYRQAWRQLHRHGAADFDLDDLDALDRALVDAFDAALSAEEAEALNDALAAAETLRHMSPRARAEHLQHRRRQLLLTRHGLLDLLKIITS